MTKQSTQGQRGKPPEMRFWEKVRKTEACWIWESAIGTRGYGIFWHGSKRRSIFAHRFSVEMRDGEMPPKGMVVMHSCDNPACVNPEHLSIGTTKENAHDSVNKRRHAYGEKNKGGGKLTEHDVRQILMSPETGAAQARRLGVSKHVVNKIRRRELWKHVSLEEPSVN